MLNKAFSVQRLVFRKKSIAMQYKPILLTPHSSPQGHLSLRSGALLTQDKEFQ